MFSEFWKQKYLQATSDLESAKKSFETEALFAGDAVKQSVKQLERKLQVLSSTSSISHDMF